MKFKYIGEAPLGQIEQYGHTFRPHEPVDVTDEAAIAKFKAHKFFKLLEEEEAPQPKNKGGRPKKQVMESEPESETDGNANSE